MPNQFFQPYDENDIDSYEACITAYPELAECVPCEGGWMCFMYMTDADVWMNQD